MSTQQPFILGDMLQTSYDAAISLFVIATKLRNGKIIFYFSIRIPYMFRYIGLQVQHVVKFILRTFRLHNHFFRVSAN